MGHKLCCQYPCPPARQKRKRQKKCLQSQAKKALRLSQELFFSFFSPLPESAMAEVGECWLLQGDWCFPAHHFRLLEETMAGYICPQQAYHKPFHPEDIQ